MYGYFSHTKTPSYKNSTSSPARTPRYKWEYFRLSLFRFNNCRPLFKSSPGNILPSNLGIDFNRISHSPVCPLSYNTNIFFSGYSKISMFILSIYPIRLSHSHILTFILNVLTSSIRNVELICWYLGLGHISPFVIVTHGPGLNGLGLKTFPLFS